jgi:integrase
VGIYKICDHKGRARDRCEHAWWACFRGHRVSLDKWAAYEVRTKSTARRAFDEMKAQVRAGTFRTSRTDQPRPVLTIETLAPIYLENHVKLHGPKSRRNIVQHLETFARAFPQPLSEIFTLDVEQFALSLRQRGNAVGTVNRYLARLRHIFNWAIGREYLDRTPFKRGSHSLIKLERENNRRQRRLSAKEETRVLEEATPLLRVLIILALDTGMRQGEMLDVTLADVDWAHQRIRLRSETTKSKKERWVPIATDRLREVLEWLRYDASGHPKPDTARLCSNEVGEGVKYFRTAWEGALIRAGIAPSPDVGAEHPELSEPLRWHDLRHEYASRLVENGVPLSQVRDLMGHASIVTTERYDTQRQEILDQVARKLETGVVIKFPSRSDRIKAAKARAARVAASRNPHKINQKELVSRPGVEPGTGRLRVCCSAN